MEDQIKRVEKGRVAIDFDYPFYGYLIWQTKLIPDESIMTLCTNGKWIKYNPEFIRTLNNKQIKTVLIHELEHIILEHHLRRAGRNPSIWNEAGDYVINYDLIYIEGLTYIEDMLLDEKYKEMSTEQVYNILIKERNDSGQNNTGDSGEDSGDSEGSQSRSSDGTGEENNSRDRGDEEESGEDISEGGEGDDGGSGDSGEKTIRDFVKNGNIGEVEDAPSDKSIPEQSERLKESIANALSYAKRAGKLPGNLERRITQILTPVIPWERLLKDWFEEKAENDFTWLKRDVRIKNYYFPSLYNEELGLIIIAIDVSGSIDEKLLNKFISEVNGLRKLYSFDTYILACDTSITYEHKFSKNEEIIIKHLGGGGGTSFKPVFNKLEEMGEIPVGVLYFTDLYCYDFGKDPGVPVLWINYGSRDSNVPFGKIINIE